MIIVCSFYYSSNKNRQQELEYTLMQNLNKEFVDEIHLFIEEKDYELFCRSNFVQNDNYHKIHCVKKNNQPTYPDLLNYCSTMKNKICCICNSDIEISIDKNEENIFNNLHNNPTLFLLSRHEYDMSSPQITNYQGSHDALIFHSDTLLNALLNALNNNIDLSFINYIQNTSGIEALLIIFFIEKLNYKLLNPCLQIKLIHHHKSNIRLWNTGNKNPVGYSSPHRLPHVNWGVHCKYMIHPCKL